MEGVAQLFKEVEKGEVKISKFIWKVEDVSPLYKMRMMMDDPLGRMSDGEYVKLIVDGKLVMSDTDMEKRTNWEFVRESNGSVLIAGLGVGLILHNIKEKFDKGEITDVTVIEKSQDVIDLVGPLFPWVKCIQADIMEYIPEKGQKWDTIYFDIWPDRNTDNLDEIKILHNRYKFKKNRENPNRWMNSWYKEELQRIKAEENRSYGGYW